MFMETMVRFQEFGNHQQPINEEPLSQPSIYSETNSGTQIVDKRTDASFPRKVRTFRGSQNLRKCKGTILLARYEKRRPGMG